MLKRIPAFITVMIILCSACMASGYDGLFFLGFNTNKDIFGDANGKLVRQAFNYAIDRNYICKKIVGDENVPSGVIPKDMQAFDKDLKGYPFDLKKAKKLLRLAGYSMKDKRLKSLKLLHTNGTMTTAIAKKITNDLSKLGVKVTSIPVDYTKEGEWEDRLSSGKEHLFLMGHKYIPPVAVPSVEAADTAYFLRVLFSSHGEANMTFLRNKKLDAMLDNIDMLPSTEATTREKDLRIIGRLLQDDPVTVNLFYIRHTN